MEIVKEIKFTRRCKKCGEKTSHTRKKLWPHIIVSLILNFWMVIWSFLSSKVTCINCGEVSRSYEQIKSLWLLMPFVAILSSLGAGLGSMEDYARNAEYLNIAYTEVQLIQRGFETFIVYLVFKIIVLVLSAFIVFVRIKIMKYELKQMIWHTRITAIILIIPVGRILIILKHIT